MWCLGQIEEELAPLIEANEVKHVDTYDEQVTKAREGAKELSWIHFLGMYNSPLTSVVEVIRI